MLEEDVSEGGNEPEEQFLYREMLIKCGIFCGILAGIFGILVLFTLLGRNSWKTGLKEKIVQVLNDNLIEGYELTGWVRLRSGLTASASAYSVSSKDGAQYAVIIRIPTLYGPVPAVYTCSSLEEDARFIGFADMNEEISLRIESASLHSQIEYWGRRLPEFLKTAEKQDGAAL
ncbi:MAG: hypothetical protein J6K96_07880 [Treponema sp.]|nr:hypothetical protein [Treponema sp.]